MPTLQVRDVPEHIYRELERRARMEHRSLAQQTLAVLAEGLGTPLNAKEQRRALLEEIRRTVDPVKTKRLQSAVKLIREDRNR